MNKENGWIGMLPGQKYQCFKKGVDDMNIKHKYGINNDCLIHTPHTVVVTATDIIEKCYLQ